MLLHVEEHARMQHAGTMQHGYAGMHHTMWFLCSVELAERVLLAEV